MSNVAIFVDYDNVYITLDRCYEDPAHLTLKHDIISKVKKIYEEENVIFSKMFLDFQTVKLSEEIFAAFRNNQFKLEHVFSGINASDISLIIDVMKNLFEDNVIDKYVIVSSDSDMLPMIKEILYRGKIVELFYFEHNTNEDYLKFLKNIGVVTHSIESLLGLTKFNKDINSIPTDKLVSLLQIVNDSILHTYKSYYIPNYKYGNATKKLIQEHLLQQTIVPKEYITRRSEENFLGFIIENLMLITHRYSINGVPNYTQILNEKYLIDNGIIINNLVRREDYSDIPDNSR